MPPLWNRLKKKVTEPRKSPTTPKNLVVEPAHAGHHLETLSGLRQKSLGQSSEVTRSSLASTLKRTSSSSASAMPGRSITKSFTAPVPPTKEAVTTKSTINNGFIPNRLTKASTTTHTNAKTTKALRRMSISKYVNPPRLSETKKDQEDDSDDDMSRRSGSVRKLPPRRPKSAFSRRGNQHAYSPGGINGKKYMEMVQEATIEKEDISGETFLEQQHQQQGDQATQRSSLLASTRTTTPPSDPSSSSDSLPIPELEINPIAAPVDEEKKKHVPPSPSFRTPRGLRDPNRYSARKLSVSRITRNMSSDDSDEDLATPISPRRSRYQEALRRRQSSKTDLCKSQAVTPIVPRKPNDTSTISQHDLPNQEPGLASGAQSSLQRKGPKISIFKSLSSKKLTFDPLTKNDGGTRGQDMRMQSDGSNLRQNAHLQQINARNMARGHSNGTNHGTLGRKLSLNSIHGETTRPNVPSAKSLPGYQSNGSIEKRAGTTTHNVPSGKSLQGFQGNGSIEKCARLPRIGSMNATKGHYANMTAQQSSQSYSDRNAKGHQPGTSGSQLHLARKSSVGSARYMAQTTSPSRATSRSSSNQFNSMERNNKTSSHNSVTQKTFMADPVTIEEKPNVTDASIARNTGAFEPIVRKKSTTDEEDLSGGFLSSFTAFFSGHSKTECSDTKADRSDANLSGHSKTECGDTKADYSDANLSHDAESVIHDSSGASSFGGIGDDSSSQSELESANGDDQQVEASITFEKIDLGMNDYKVPFPVAEPETRTINALVDKRYRSKATKGPTSLNPSTSGHESSEPLRLKRRAKSIHSSNPMSEILRRNRRKKDRKNMRTNQKPVAGK